MADPLARLRRFLRELKRRNVYRVAVTYAVVAFVVWQAASLLFPALDFPAWTVDFVIVLTLLGFPVALVLAWAFEVTPEGVRRTPAGDAALPGNATPAEDGAASKAFPGPGERRSRSRAAIKALVALGTVGAAAVGSWYLMGGGGESPEIREGTVAVLPFRVSGAGAEEWQEGIGSLVSTGLDGAAGLRAVSDQAVFTASGGEGSSSTSSRASRPAAIARELGARYVIRGEAIQLGDDLRLTAVVRDASSGERLQRVAVRGSPGQVADLADSLTRRVLDVLLDESDVAIPGLDLATLTTRSNEALKDFLAGELYVRRGEYEEAVERFEAAVARDSTFALAHARLAYYGEWLSHEGSGRHFERAHDLADRLPRRDRRLVRARYLYQGVQGNNLVARDSLEVLVRDYPDDPKVWYDLGDVILHTPAAPGWAMADSAFQRAVELDPRNVGYHDHAVDLAISFHHDSALAARRIEATPSEQYRRHLGLAHRLVFGSADARQDALAAFDTLQMKGSSSWAVAGTLWHPADGAVRESLHRSRLQRRDLSTEARRDVSGDLVAALMDQGKIGEAIRVIEDPDRPVGVGVETRVVLLLTLDVPVPDSLARAALDVSGPPEGTGPGRVTVHGLRLIERGDASKLEAVLGVLERQVDASDGGDGSTGRAAARLRRELRGYAAWKDGRLREARRLWSTSNPSDAFGAVWRGDLYRELDDLQKAEGWYLAAWRQPVAHERLGQLYEEMGRPEEAAAAYRRFVASWKDADPALQPRVEAARERLARLTGPEDGPDG